MFRLAQFSSWFQEFQALVSYFPVHLICDLKDFCVVVERDASLSCQFSKRCGLGTKTVRTKLASSCRELTYIRINGARAGPPPYFFTARFMFLDSEMSTSSV